MQLRRLALLWCAWRCDAIVRVVPWRMGHEPIAKPTAAHGDGHVDWRLPMVSREVRARGVACILTDGDETGDPLGLAGADEARDPLEVRERWPELRNIQGSIRACRTLDEAELAVKLESDFRTDPSILRDIDFRALRSRLNLDVKSRLDQGVSVDVLSAEQVADMHVRLKEAMRALGEIVPRYNDTRPGAVAVAVPKLRRAINQARELPLAVEIPRPADPQEALRESQNIAMAVKEVWSRLTDAAGAAQEEQLVALQKESKALLAIRAEAIKLRAGIRLVQRQKDLKRPLLIRYDSEALLEETRQADGSLMRLQIELSLKASLLEMERIFIVLKAELLSGSTLTDELLPLVDNYSWLEQALLTPLSLSLLLSHSRPSFLSLSLSFFLSPSLFMF